MPNFGGRSAPASASAVIPAASSAKLSDNSSRVNQRERKSGGPAREIVADLIQRCSANSGSVFRSGGRQ
jgi:hypothetical protein